MHEPFDPRVWNLLSGAALLAGGCSSRVAGDDDATVTTDETEAGESGPMPECVVDNDCPAGYECKGGSCYYIPYDDGWLPYYDCYSDAECPQFEICELGYCKMLGAPPPTCELAQAASPIPVLGEAVALSFADLDGDGQDDELVVATQAELLSYDAVDAAPVATPRDAVPITQLVVGEFDAQPGEDLLALVGDATTILFASNGDGSFSAGPASATALASLAGLVAGDFDGAPPTDVLAWGTDGAYVERGGVAEVFELDMVDAGAALGLDQPAPGYYLRVLGALRFYDLDGQEQVIVPGDSSAPPTLAALASPSGPIIASTRAYPGWSQLVFHQAATGMGVGERSIPGVYAQILAGDLDGDGFDELVFNADEGMAILFEPLGEGEGRCWDVPIVLSEGTARGVAFGDIDGDGDDELAVLTSLGEVGLIDGG